jgi:ABC-type Mn2+/Zn2+ transport system permease subunit
VVAAERINTGSSSSSLSAFDVIAGVVFHFNFALGVVLASSTGGRQQEVLALYRRVFWCNFKSAYFTSAIAVVAAGVIVHIAVAVLNIALSEATSKQTVRFAFAPAFTTTTAALGFAFVAALCCFPLLTTP